MLGDLITRVLVMLFGYAYPALQCYKVVERNRVEIEELRFWCQYWVLVALLTVLERVGDVFVSWIPMYGELKLSLFIYLWYPKTKGSEYVYDAILKPYVAKHETEIERRLEDWRARAWDLAVFYWKNCTELGQDKFFEVLQFLASQSARMSNKDKEKEEGEQQNGRKSSFFGKSKKGSSSSSSSSAVPPGSPINRAISETLKSKIVQVEPPNGTTEHVRIEESFMTDSATKQDSDSNPINQARQRLRRLKPHN
ncbi:hypothetical protein UlMin_042805 [Ulmus minor]